MKYVYLVIMAGIFAGCGQDSANTYRVPRVPAEDVKVTAPKEVATPVASPAASTPNAAGFTAVLPTGWSEKPASGMRKAIYAIEGSDIDFYLIILGMGDLDSNVNRWREQIGLAAASSEEIASSVDQFEANGNSVTLAELYNAENGKGIIAAILTNGSEYWFFTGKGSAVELKKHAAEIRAFMESVTIQN